MEHSPIIFVAGMPRSGSMWTYNVCRKLIVAAGKSPWPEAVPQDETPLIKEALSRPPEPGQVYCIKTHFQVPVGQPHMRIICNYRDVRDALLSYMRFMKCSFDKGLSVARGCMAITDHYLQQPHPHVFPVRYDHMTGNPDKVIASLAEFLALTVSHEDIVEIEQALSRSAVKKHLASIESRQHTTGNMARNLDGSVRAYDETTGFQSDHISGGSDGEWRDVLSSEQQAELMATCSDWLTRYEFND